MFNFAVNFCNFQKKIFVVLASTFGGWVFTWTITYCINLPECEPLCIGLLDLTDKEEPLFYLLK